MSEPLSNLQPPDPGLASSSEARPLSPKSELGLARSQLEWVITDFEASKMPGTEIFLPGLWRRMHEDGTFGMFFHEGEDMTFVQFGGVLTNPASKIQLIIGHDADGTAKEHAGLLILDHILANDTVKRAVGNFLFFKEYWHRHDSLEIGRAVMDHWFFNMGFDVIAGITPRANRAAIVFIKRLGFQIVGDVPDFTMYEGKKCASATSFMTKDMWIRKRDG